MKTLWMIPALLMLLGLPAFSAPQPAPQAADIAGERWEVVSDLYVGIHTEELTEEERAAYGDLLYWRCGLRITKVLADSPAEKAGLKAGDILMINCGCRIRRMEDLLLSMRNTRPGQLMHFVILRGRDKIPVVIRMEALPEPVVVAYVTPIEPGARGTEGVEKCKKRIADLLAAEVPDIAAVGEVVTELNELFPYHERPGQIRLYYATPGGLVSVTVYPWGISVNLPYEQGGSDTYNLRRQGDTLPEHVRKILAPHGYPKN